MKNDVYNNITIYLEVIMQAFENFDKNELINRKNELSKNTKTLKNKV